MPIRPHTCLTLDCDICHQPYAPDDYEAHLPDLREAAVTAQRDGWTVTTGGQVYCPTRDEAHQAAFDALMPPEPVGTTAP